MKSIQIQSGRQQPSGNLKVEPRARRDPIDVPCIYHKGARHALRGCRLRKQIGQERDAPSHDAPGHGAPSTQGDIAALHLCIHSGGQRGVGGRAT
jgi:hypothetical protein